MAGEFVNPPLNVEEPVLQCDLCGGTEFETILDISTGWAMLSDRRKVPARLRKIGCRRCGLVRNDTAMRAPSNQGAAALDGFYTHDYQQAALGEHLFYTLAGPRSRSSVIVDWMMADDRRAFWDSARRILEIGSGNGGVLRELRARLPGVTIEGQELHAEAAAALRARGEIVHDVPLHRIVRTGYDRACSIAVLEHVQSPLQFLLCIRHLLGEDGFLMLVQPTQDVPSTDLFFLDHVHHFATAHLAGYAQQAGFVEIEKVIGHDLMPNFSLHLWRTSSQAAASRGWEQPAVHSASRQAATHMLADFAQLDRLIDTLRTEGRPVIVFGLAEVFALLTTYTRLDPGIIAGGLVDGHSPSGSYPFPVMTPEAWDLRSGRDVVLATNRVHYPLVRPRLEQLGFRVHEVFSK